MSETAIPFGLHGPTICGQSGLDALAADADGVYWSSDRGDVVWARR